MFVKLRKPNRGTLRSPEDSRSYISGLVPEDRREVVDSSAGSLGISMEFGILKSAVQDVCRALIVQKEFPDSEAEEYSRAQKLIEGRMVDLGMHRAAVAQCGGDSQLASESNLKNIRILVENAYSPGTPMELAPVPTAPPIAGPASRRLAA